MSKRSKSQKSDDQILSADTPDGLLDVLGAAQWLGVSRTKLFELMQVDDLPVIRISDRVVRFDPNSLYKWALSHQKSGSRIA